MAQQTAIDFLVTVLIPSSTLPIKTINDFIAQAKEMEKEQIMDAFNDSELHNTGNKNDAEIYYNYTYNK